MWRSCERQVEDGDHTLMTKEEILNKIATLTGGRAAEELIFHSITTGASNDLPFYLVQGPLHY